MSKLEVDAIEPQSGTTLTLGASGDAVNIASGATITDFTSTGIDDNATSTAITIDSSENVGIGTTSPSRGDYGSVDPKLHVDSTGSSGTFTLVSRLESGGDADNTGAALLINHQNDRGLLIEGGRGSGDQGVGHLGIVTASGSYSRILTLLQDGNVGIGTSSPTVKLEVIGNAIIGSGVNGSESAAYLELDGAGYRGFHWLDGTAYYIGQNSNSRSLRIYSGSNEAVGAQLGAGGNSFGTFSDERLKKNITDLTNGLDKISAMRPVNFKYKTDEDDYRNRIGIIAQSIVGQVDEALDLSRLNDTDTTEYYNVRYQDLIPVLVKGMQEQQTKIQELEARITALENA